MNIQQLYEFCLSKKGVTEHFPFDQETLVFKVGEKIVEFNRTSHNKSIEDLIDFMVARILDHLQLQQNIMPRWGYAPVTAATRL